MWLTAQVSISTWFKPRYTHICCLHHPQWNQSFWLPAILFIHTSGVGKTSDTCVGRDAWWYLLYFSVVAIVLFHVSLYIYFLMWGTKPSTLAFVISYCEYIWTRKRVMVSPSIVPVSRDDTRRNCADGIAGFTNRLIYIPRCISR